jgi:dienelactone hydrolase
MKKLFISLLVCLVAISSSASTEPIVFKKYYPVGNGPFPVVINLHTSGGPFGKGMTRRSEMLVANGFAVYEPDFFSRHNITHKTRVDTWTKYRKNIESELSEIVELAKQDSKVDSKNTFAVGWSNGGYWATYLAATKQVNAGASVYGVWQFGDKLNGYPAKYVNQNSNPILALHGKKETVQRFNSVMPFIKKAQSQSSKVELKVYDNAGHSWDVPRAGMKDGYNQEVTEDANKRIVAFFKKNFK